MKSSPMKNPFDSFYHVPNSQTLLDIAFRRSMKSSAQVSKNAPILIKAKKKEGRRIHVAIKTIVDKILKIIKSVPMIDELPDFYRELASTIVDTEKLKLTLGKLNGILPVLSKIEREYLGKLGRIEEPKEGDRIRRAVFGRISSILKKQDENLTYLNQIRGKLREIPSIDYNMPCVVIAGAPNVGKSSIVKHISTNKKINVQEYPFTTKKLILGHITLERRFDTLRVQIMDTPGILDRPMSERNSIELQAILALRHISELIVFIFDPSLASGYSVESQITLYEEIKENFTKKGNIDLITVFNKKDLASPSEIENLRKELSIEAEDYFLTNALTGENLDELKEYIIKRYMDDQ
ncbi:MAG: GTP-binding protein [Promethearchaeota archaeon]|nr:MAG: GTP-binding protein [Candidatus Lokiarchaeota archaeon]